MTSAVAHHAGAEAVGFSAEIAAILDRAYTDPAQRWSARSVAETLGVPGASAIIAPCGCALLRVAADEGEILTLAVDPAARRRGVGAALLAACLARAAGVGARRVHLEVGAENRAARLLYAGAGFVEVGRRRGYYPAGCTRQDAILMARELA